jgi:hypothetical protein
VRDVEHVAGVANVGEGDAVRGAGEDAFEHVETHADVVVFEPAGAAALSNDIVVAGGHLSVACFKECRLGALSYVFLEQFA